MRRGNHTNPIRIIQLNTNRRNIVCHALLNSTTCNFDIVLLTEPWFGNIGNSQRGPVAGPGWVPILPLQPIPDNVTPRVMAYVRRRNDFTVTLRSDLASDADLQILQIDQPPHTPVIVANVYNQRAGDDPQLWTIDRLVNVTFPTNLPVIVSGDWNLHHPLWSANDCPPSPKAEMLVDWTLENGLVMLNEKGTPTFFSHDGRSLSTLDLTFANHAAVTEEAVCNWRVDRDLSCDSDHFALTWSIDRASHPINNVTAQKYRWKDVDRDKRMAWKAKYTTEINERRWIFDQLALSEMPSWLQRKHISLYVGTASMQDHGGPMTCLTASKIYETSVMQPRLSARSRATLTQTPSV